MIYRFRVIYAHEDEDVFRDIEIAATDTLEDLHNTILQAFGFDGNEMASFYKSNEAWEEGEEISLFDLGDEPGKAQVMNETFLEDVFSESQTRMIYTYDFLSMWTFMVELADIGEREEGQAYPNLMYVHGQIPFEPEDDDIYLDHPDEGFDDDDYDEFYDDYDFDQDYEDLGFDENWN